MKIRFLLSLLALGTTLRAADEKPKNCGCDCCQGAKICCCSTETATADQPTVPSNQPQSHPVKGVIMGLMKDKTALLVKHEEVPGVMRAMTMMFKVDPAVLERVKREDHIRGKMQRRADGWWLLDVEVTTPAK